MSVIVTGSVAFDHIMVFPGYFKDHILPEKVHILNVSFLVDALKKQRGGCAPNIAYSLALLGEAPVIMATVGSDFDEYRQWLEGHGVDTSLTMTIEDEFTASAFITTDRADNQITGFYVGAMREAGVLSFHQVSREIVSLAIISPNDPAAMVKYARECRELNLPFIFDPGQQTSALAPHELREGMRGARAVVGNDYEFELICARTGLDVAGILQYSPLLVVTKGEKGSVMHTREGAIHIPAARPHRVVDPTGAGDAYRAGLIHGLAEGRGLEETGRIAAVAAVYAVEEYGTLAHHYTRADFDRRYQENFGAAESPPQEPRDPGDDRRSVRHLEEAS